MLKTKNLLDWIILIQLVFYFIAVSFSAGGGNYPRLQSNGFYLFKGLFLSVPLLLTSVILFIKPQKLVIQFKTFFKNNVFLILYFALAGILIIFSDEQSYALTRYLYTCLGFFSLACIIIFYQFNANDPDFQAIYTRHLNIVSCIILLFPAYAFIKSGFNITHIRGFISDSGLIHPNILASLLAHFFIWHFFQYRQDRLKFNAFMIFVLLFVQLLLFSRTAILSLIATSFVISIFIFAKQRTLSSILYLLSGILLGLISLILVWLKVISPEHIFSILIRDDSVGSMLTLTNRTTLWLQLLENIDLKVFFAGYGYSIIDPGFGIDFGTGILYGAHNAYLSVLLGSGIFCLILVLSYLFKNIISFAAHYKILSNHHFYLVLSSYSVFLINCFLSEEIGINMAPTFSYLILLSNLIFFSCERKR